MKIITCILMCLFFAVNSQAQSKPKFNIKAVSKNGRITKGLLFAVNKNELILLKNKQDTLKINFNDLKHLYVKRKGVVLPFILTGAVVFVIVATQSTNPLTQLGNVIAGVPVGVAIGSLVGQLFANKKFYRHIAANDFPEISANLQQYAQVNAAKN